jgi:uncharacterized coiled-coil protein SlyX
MSEQSDETLKQDDSPVLKAIAELAQRLENFEKTTNAQFEAIRKGIVENNVRFERLAADVHESRADISRLRANFAELTEEIRESKKTLV